MTLGRWRWKVMSTPLGGLSGSQSTEVFYLLGKGVFFCLHFRFPLIPPGGRQGKREVRRAWKGKGSLSGPHRPRPAASLAFLLLQRGRPWPSFALLPSPPPSPSSWAGWQSADFGARAGRPGAPGMPLHKKLAPLLGQPGRLIFAFKALGISKKHRKSKGGEGAPACDGGVNHESPPPQTHMSFLAVPLPGLVLLGST